MVFKFKSFVVVRLMSKVGFKWKQLDKRINILGYIVIWIILGKIFAILYSLLYHSSSSAILYSLLYHSSSSPIISSLCIQILLIMSA